MKPKGSRLLTVNQFCKEYSWPSVSALRKIIWDANNGVNDFSKSIIRMGRRVLIDEEVFWECVGNSQ